MLDIIVTYRYIQYPSQGGMEGIVVIQLVLRSVPSTKTEIKSTEEGSRSVNNNYLLMMGPPDSPAEITNTPSSLVELYIYIYTKTKTSSLNSSCEHHHHTCWLQVHIVHTCMHVVH